MMVFVMVGAPALDAHTNKRTHMALADAFIQQVTHSGAKAGSQQNNFGGPAQDRPAQNLVAIGIKSGCHTGELFGL